MHVCVLVCLCLCLSGLCDCVLMLFFLDGLSCRFVVTSFCCFVVVGLPFGRLVACMRVRLFVRLLCCSCVSIVVFVV